jgi:hypothetical protein
MLVIMISTVYINIYMCLWQLFRSISCHFHSTAAVLSHRAHDSRHSQPCRYLEHTDNEYYITLPQRFLVESYAWIRKSSIYIYTYVTYYHHGDLARRICEIRRHYQMWTGTKPRRLELLPCVHVGKVFRVFTENCSALQETTTMPMIRKTKASNAKLSKRTNRDPSILLYRLENTY